MVVLKGSHETLIVINTYYQHELGSLKARDRACRA